VFVNVTAQDDHSSDDIALAGEYVLRLLSTADAAAFGRRLRQTPALRRLVSEWEHALTPLTDEIDDVAPPARVLARIEARIFEKHKSRRGFLGWGSAVAGLAVAAAVAAFILFSPVATQAPTHSAQIVAEDNALVLRANYNAEAGALEIDRITGDAPAGRVLELWLIADGAPAPVSLGVLEGAQMRLLVAENQRAALETGVLAVSEEPPGGSPTGAPTGAVLAVGPVVPL